MVAVHSLKGCQTGSYSGHSDAQDDVLVETWLALESARPSFFFLL